jgi:hypothetical protein
MTQTMTTKRDLRNWVDSALGADGTGEMIHAVTDAIAEGQCPNWGTDWAQFLETIDVWHIAEQLGL